MTSKRRYATRVKMSRLLTLVRQRTRTNTGNHNNTGRTDSSTDGDDADIISLENVEEDTVLEVDVEEEVEDVQDHHQENNFSCNGEQRDVFNITSENCHTEARAQTNVANVGNVGRTSGEGILDEQTNADIDCRERDNNRHSSDSDCEKDAAKKLLQEVKITGRKLDVAFGEQRYG